MPLKNFVQHHLDHYRLSDIICTQPAVDSDADQNLLVVRLSPLLGDQNRYKNGRKVKKANKNPTDYLKLCGGQDDVERFLSFIWLSKFSCR
jgi:hypothetical protein